MTTQVEFIGIKAFLRHLSNFERKLAIDLNIQGLTYSW